MIVLCTRELYQLVIVDSGSGSTALGLYNIIDTNPVGVILEFGFLSEEMAGGELEHFSSTLRCHVLVIDLCPNAYGKV
jgi:hypothetical protein